MSEFINLTPPKGGASAQNAFDIFKGSWAYDVPVDGTVTGKYETFRRTPPGIAMMQQHFPDHGNFDVLELGPHEGEHSFHLNKMVRHVYAIEGRPANFLKCLVVKNELAMHRVRFAVGDFVQYLASPASSKTWDLTYCCGVLYHMADPAELLRLISTKSRRLILTTQVFDWEAMKIADAHTESIKLFPTNWCRDTEQSPTRHEAKTGVYDYHRRVYFDTARQSVLGHGASHTLHAHMISADTLKRIIEDVGGKLLHWQVHTNPRGPTTDAVVDFSHLHGG